MRLGLENKFESFRRAVIETGIKFRAAHLLKANEIDKSSHEDEDGTADPAGKH